MNKIKMIWLILSMLMACEKMPTKTETVYRGAIIGYMDPDKRSNFIRISKINHWKDTLSNEELENSNLVINGEEVKFSYQDEYRVNQRQRIIDIEYDFKHEETYEIEFHAFGLFEGKSRFVIPEGLNLNYEWRNDDIRLTWNEADYSDFYLLKGYFDENKDDFIYDFPFVFDSLEKEQDRYLKDTLYVIRSKELIENIKDFIDFKTGGGVKGSPPNTLTLRMYALPEEMKLYFESSLYDYTNLEGNAAGLISGYTQDEITIDIQYGEDGNPMLTKRKE